MADRGNGLTYAEAGVDTRAQRRVTEALADRIGFQRRGDGRPLMGLTHYSGLVQLGDRALSICTDGVGTKVLIARALDQWDTIGIDVVAMNVNDCICVGAEPLAFVDYLAMETPDEKVSAKIGVGLNAGARLANVSLVGGETAIMPEVVAGLDLAGTCVGVVDRDKILDGKRVRAGDAIIGLASSGFHSNGYTLVRRVLQQSNIGLSEPCPGSGGRRWGRLLLEPTRIYVRPIVGLLTRTKVHALAHITGGGLKNLPRMNHRVRYVITEPMDVPAEIEAVQGLGNIDWTEMYSTFNMGMGLAIVVARDDADDTVKYLRRRGEDARIVGRVERGRGVTHEPTGLTFESKTRGRVG